MRLSSCQSGDAHSDSVVSGVMPSWKGGAELAHDAKVVLVGWDHGFYGVATCCVVDGAKDVVDGEGMVRVLLEENRNAEAGYLDVEVDVLVR